MKQIALSVLLIAGLLTAVDAQAPQKPSSVDIYNKLEKLNFLGTVLYLAAHPDDENTRLISYLANEVHARTGYLSLTRGDGGQNLISTDIREKLGLIRTQELLAARRVDGGTQFFTRANDFGFSKHPDETLSIWNKDEVMHDIVKVIREFQPDVIINRFDHRTAGETHGHHTSSAMLSIEAFDLVNQSDYQLDRLKDYEPWQPKRVFFNTSWWFYGSQDKFKQADKSNLVAIDAGVYYADNGKSNTEIAALSRSMHKSQGFGSTGTRGSEMEYLELVKGEMPTDKGNIFSGINTTWSRVDGGEEIGQKIENLLSSFNFSNPSIHTTELLEIYQSINRLSDSHWKRIKLNEISEIILSSTGLFIEVVSNQAFASRSQNIELTAETINRSDATIQLKGIQVNSIVNKELDITLENNNGIKTQINLLIPQEEPYSNPYWLNKEGTLGMYAVENDKLIGQPENEAALTSEISLQINGVPIMAKRDVVYKKNDPVDGEVYAPFAVLPAASIKFSNPVYIFASRDEKEVEVIVKSFSDTLLATITLDHPGGWIVTPAAQVVRLYGKGAEEKFIFKVKGPYLQESAVMNARLILNNDELINQEITELTFDHIPKQYLFSPAQSKFERISLEIKGKNIAYIEGAGDEVPQSLRQIGYDVTIVDVSEVTKEKLANYDALIVGIRAYNTKPELFLKKEIMEDYMNMGGTVIVQYNTTGGGIKGENIAPYPMTISRDRVTEENAPVSFTDVDHEVLNYPNKITNRDFEKWVQERGLYFPNKWDEKYSTPLASSDKGEPLTKGGLLIAPVGKGYFVYTGLSWFRELPAGVAGAYRLFANIISIGKNGLKVSENSNIPQNKDGQK
jgi:LmbE family N-acetylglucosaminyl deacetylase